MKNLSRKIREGVRAKAQPEVFDKVWVSIRNIVSGSSSSSPWWEVGSNVYSYLLSLTRHKA